MASIAHLNAWAVLTAGLSYFVLGTVWYSVFFGKIWMREMERVGARMQPPTKIDMFFRMLATLITNFIVVLALASLLMYVNAASFTLALDLSLLVAVGFIAAVMTTVYIWQNSSLKLYFIDLGYPVIGTILATVILVLWR